MSSCFYPSCMMGGQGCDRESTCDEEKNKENIVAKTKEIECYVHKNEMASFGETTSRVVVWSQYPATDTVLKAKLIDEVIALLCHLMVFRSIRYYQGYVRLKKAPSAQEGR
jgi:hypothetical protein